MKFLTASRAAGLLLGAALSAATASSQSMPGDGKAIVSGRFTAPNGGPPPSQGYVIFAANGQSILETKTDHDGNWKAEIAPGSYDVIFKTNVLFGERVDGVQLHPGEQEFSPVRGHIAYPHLGLIDGPGETFTTMGEVAITASYFYPVSYFFKHPIRYLNSMQRAFASSNKLGRLPS